MESWRKHEVDYLHVEAETVLVNGRAVPGVTALHLPNGRLQLHVGTHAFEADIFEGEAIVGLVADAVAIGAGYVGWPDAEGEFVPRPFAARWRQIGGVSHDLD